MVDDHDASFVVSTSLDKGSSRISSWKIVSGVLAPAGFKHHNGWISNTERFDTAMLCFSPRAFSTSSGWRQQHKGWTNNQRPVQNFWGGFASFCRCMRGNSYVRTGSAKQIFYRCGHKAHFCNQTLILAIKKTYEQRPEEFMQQPLHESSYGRKCCPNHGKRYGELF